MKRYTSYPKAVINLHERGFTEDFAPTGKNLFWIQQKISFNNEDCEVVEQHRFQLTEKKQYTVLAVIAKSIGIKGILILQDSIANETSTSSNNCFRSTASKPSTQRIAVMLQ